MKKSIQKSRPLDVSILGGGAFGSAMAVCALKAGARVKIWGRSAQSFSLSLKEILNKTKPFFSSDPSNAIPKDIKNSLEYTTNLQEACVNPVLILALPAQCLRKFLKDLKPLLQSPSFYTIIFTSKGIEKKTGCFVHEIASQEISEESYGILSGPNLSSEILDGAPTTANLFLQNSKNFSQIHSSLASKDFILFRALCPFSLTVPGVLKNILSIAMGFLERMQTGKNIQGSFFARGFQDITRLFLGVSPADKGRFLSYQDLHSLSQEGALGDFFLTCSSPKSRNYQLGLLLGEFFNNFFHTASTLNFHEFLKKHYNKDSLPLAEGFFSLEGLWRRIQHLNINLPTVQSVTALCLWANILNFEDRDLYNRTKDQCFLSGDSSLYHGSFPLKKTSLNQFHSLEEFTWCFLSFFV